MSEASAIPQTVRTACRRVSGRFGGPFILVVVLCLVAFGQFGFATGMALAGEQVATEAETSGGVSLAAPKLTAADYPQIAGINSRAVVWLVAQLHLWFAAFVLAVPIFVFIIEAIGMKTREKRYDDMAYEFIKVSITAYSLTAILGGLLLISLFGLLSSPVRLSDRHLQGVDVLLCAPVLHRERLPCTSTTTAGIGCRAAF